MVNINSVSTMEDQVENLFATLKDWRGIATRYDRCAHIFLSALLLDATLFFSLSLLSLRRTKFKLDWEVPTPR